MSAPATVRGDPAQRVDPDTYRRLFVAEHLAVLVYLRADSQDNVGVSVDEAADGSLPFTATLKRGDEIIRVARGETQDVALATLIQGLAVQHYEQMVRGLKARKAGR